MNYNCDAYDLNVTTLTPLMGLQSILVRNKHASRQLCLACTSAFLVADLILISLQQLAVSQRTHETSTQSQHAPSNKTHNNKAERVLTES